MPTYKIIEGSMHHQFSLSRKKVQVLGGGFGNGKTAAVCVKAIQLAQGYPGSNGLIARENYVKLNDTIRKEFYKWCPANSVARWPTTNDNTLIFKNGSTVNFRYISQRGKKTIDGNTTSNLLSATFDWAVVDQIEDPEIQYKDFLDIMGRMRGSTPYKGNDPTMPLTGPRYVLLTANPSANWVYQKLIKPYHQYLATGVVTEDLLVDPDTLEPIMDLFEGSTYENAHNLDEDFIKGLEASYKGQMRDRFLMGKWAAYEGLVYPEFGLDTHTVSKEEIERILLRSTKSKVRFSGIEGFDLGITQPSCYLCGFVDEEGHVFIVDGFYEPGLSTDQIKAMIREKRSEWAWAIDFDEEPLWADPAIFKKTQVKGQTTTTVAKLLMEDGDIWIKPGQNDIKNGIMKVAGYLAIRPNFHYNDPTAPAPGMFFRNDLQFIFDEFTAYFWKTDQGGDRIDEPRDKNDHAMDTLKYLLSRAPDPSTLVFRRPFLTPEYLKWQERQ